MKKKYLVVAALVLAAGGVAAIVLLTTRKVGPLPPPPAVVFEAPPALGGLWISTPVVNQSSSSQAVQVFAGFVTTTGRKIESGTGVFTLAAGQARSYTAVSLVAYGGAGLLTGQVWIADAEGNVIGSPVPLTITI